MVWWIIVYVTLWILLIKIYLVIEFHFFGSPVPVAL